MKNNRASLTTAQAERLMRNIGDPPFSLGILDALSVGEGETSVIQLNLGLQSDVDLYEQLHNNPDKFEVVQESDFGGGRSSVKCVVRYVRKGQWKLEMPEDSEKPSSKKSSRSSKKKEEEPVIGFGAVVSRPSAKKKAVKVKKKTPRKKKKAPAKKKRSSPKRSRPVKKSQPKRKKAKKKSSRS